MQPKRIDAAADKADVTLGILAAVERGTETTQRSIADELGIALGLVNAYLRRCVGKGLIKVQQVPPRRFAYYLTPRGFAEKSRLTASYLTSSFEFFRHARHDCEEAMRAVTDAGWSRVVLVGATDLAEIATICAVDRRLTIVGVADRTIGRDSFVGQPVLTDLAAVRDHADVAVLTELRRAPAAYDEAVAVFGSERVIVPALLHPMLGPADRVDGATP